MQQVIHTHKEKYLNLGERIMSFAGREFFCHFNICDYNKILYLSIIWTKFKNGFWIIEIQSFTSLCQHKGQCFNFTNYMEHSPSWIALSYSDRQEVLHLLWNPGFFLPCLREPVKLEAIQCHNMLFFCPHPTSKLKDNPLLVSMTAYELYLQLFSISGTCLNP